MEIDGREMDGEGVVVVFELDEIGLVENFCERRIVLDGVEGMIDDVEIRE